MLLLFMFYGTYKCVIETFETKSFHIRINIKNLKIPVNERFIIEEFDWWECDFKMNLFLPTSYQMLANVFKIQNRAEPFIKEPDEYDYEFRGMVQNNKHWIAFIRLLFYIHFVAFYLSIVFISNTILSNNVCKQPGKWKRYFTKLKERMVYKNITCLRCH